MFALTQNKVNLDEKNNVWLDEESVLMEDLEEMEQENETDEELYGDAS